jgi:hypothetical protein
VRLAQGAHGGAHFGPPKQYGRMAQNQEAIGRLRQPASARVGSTGAVAQLSLLGSEVQSSAVVGVAKLRAHIGPEERAHDVTGNRKSGLELRHSVPSAVNPPPVTMQFTCGCSVNSRVQVCSTAVMPRGRLPERARV